MTADSLTLRVGSRGSRDDVLLVASAILSGYANDPAVVAAAARLTQSSSRPWVPIPNHPGYHISVRGEVRGPRGAILQHHRGRVRLGHGKAWITVSDLIAESFRDAGIAIISKETINVDHQTPTGSAHAAAERYINEALGWRPPDLRPSGTDPVP